MTLLLEIGTNLGVEDTVCRTGMYVSVENTFKVGLCRYRRILERFFFRVFFRTREGKKGQAKKLEQ
jgi:hypothetical protein